MRCLACATRHLHTWINRVQSRFEIPFCCVGSVWAASLGSSTMLTTFPTKYLSLILQLATPLWGSEKSQPSSFSSHCNARSVRCVFCFPFLLYFALLSLCSGCNMLEDLSHDSALAFLLQGNLPGKHPGNRMLLQFVSGNTEKKEQYTH